MAVKTKKAKKKIVKKKSVALTTNILVRAVKSGSSNLAKDAIKLMGYTVKEDKGWVVREYKDGSIKKISKIDKSKRPRVLVLN